MKAWVIKDIKRDEYVVGDWGAACEFGPLSRACLFNDFEQAKRLCSPQYGEKLVKIEIKELS